MQPQNDERTIAIIREAADRWSVPRQYALAFAWLESRLDPSAEGDIGWHLRGDRYTRLVLGNDLLSSNPGRDTPECWHSYGLFQLLACYHVHPHEHPTILLDPKINADRGCAELARLLRRTHGDILRARYAYVGAGINGQHVSEDARKLIAHRLSEALKRYDQEGGGTA